MNYYQRQTGKRFSDKDINNWKVIDRAKIQPFSNSDQRTMPHLIPKAVVADRRKKKEL